MCSEVLKCTFALSSPPEKKAPNATRMNLAQFCLVIPSVCVMLLTPVSGVLFCAPVQVSHVQRSVIYRLAEQKKKKSQLKSCLNQIMKGCTLKSVKAPIPKDCILAKTEI